MNVIAFFAIIITLITFFIIGHFVALLLKIDTYSDDIAKGFVKTIIGMLSCITLCAIICSHGNTILWGVPLIACMCYYNNRKNITNVALPTPNELYSIGLIVILALVAFSHQAHLFYNPPYNNIPHVDYGYYGTLGELMKEHHTESGIFVSNLFSESTAATPYHYLDVWFGVLINSVFSINIVESLYVIVYPILFALYTSAIIVITRSFSHKIIIQLASFIILLFYPFAWFDFTLPITEILRQPTFSNFDSLVNPKTEIIAVLFAFSLSIYLYNNKNFYISLLILPIASSVTAPAIFSALGILFIINILQRRKIDKRDVLAIIELTLIALFIMLFYLLQDKNAQTEEFTISTIIETIRLKKTIIFKSCCKLIVVLGIIYTPFTLALIRLRKRNYKQYSKLRELIIFTILLCLCGFIFSQISQKLLNATQFYTIPSLILPLIYGIILFITYINENKKHIKITIALYGILLAIYSITNIKAHPTWNSIRYAQQNKYSTEYLSNIKKHSTQIGASFSTSFCPHYFYATDSLNIKTCSIDSSLLFKKNTAFGYYNTIQNTNLNKSIDEIQFDFVKEQDLRFIILEQGQILAPIFDTIIDTIYTERNTKQQFIVLKQ